MKALIRKTFGGLLAAAMAAACYWSIRLACADHLSRSDAADSVEAALRLAPGSSGFWLHWADLEEAAGHSGAAGIRHAADSDPYNAQVWIRSGLDAEMNGDFTRAEQDLLLAARRSRQFEPRWTLANYYFRRGDAEHFWEWAKSALAWSYADRRLLFDLCWRMQPDAGVILDRAIPDNSKVLREYLSFLIGHNQPEAAVAVAHRLEASASDDDRKLLLHYADWMLDNRQWQAALSAWNALCVRRVVDYEQIDAKAGRLLTNGELSAHPLDSGFDWRFQHLDGVSAIYNESPSWLRFDFSGGQPERCRVIYQFVPVAPEQRYVLRFGYRTEDIPAGSGLRWRVRDATTNTDIPVEPMDLSSEKWAKGAVAFTAPAGVQAARIELYYERQPGTVRVEGSLWLRKVGLEWRR